MATTITTSSKNYFNKIKKYLGNKKLCFASTINRSASPLGSSKNGVYTIIIFNLDEIDSFHLGQKMTKPFHLTSKQLEPMALAA